MDVIKLIAFIFFITLILLLLIYSTNLFKIEQKDHRYPLSDHYDGRRFHNVGESVNNLKRLFEFFKWRLTRHAPSWPSFVNDNVKANLPQIVAADEAYITFINHSSFLIQIADINILTDPIFSERASPFSWIGPKRVRNPGLTISETPTIHYVLVSHNHYDHLDLPSLIKLNEKDHPLFIVPLGNGKYLKSAGINHILELDWWQTYQLNESFSITLVPAEHWSQRTLFDSRSALWGGYVIEFGDNTIFYAGDTGDGSHFDAIRKRFGKIDISLLPIGAYEPRWFMKAKHINPEEAVLVHQRIGSTLCIAGHFNTFSLGDEAIDQPQKDLVAALQNHRLTQKEFIIPKNGQTIHWRSKKLK